jgi:hypothetical protein
MLGLGTSLVKGGKVGRAYVKDGLKLYMPYRGDNTTKGVQFVGTGSTSFDSTDDYIQIADSADWDFGTGAWSVAFWVKATEDVFSYAIWRGSSVSGASSARRWGIAYYSDNDSYYYYGDQTGTESGEQDITVDSGDYLNKWTHVVYTRGDDTLGRLYVNGDLKGTSSADTQNHSNSDPIFIGAGQNSWVSKSMKNVAIWNRALTATEVQNVMYKSYAEVSGRLASGLVSWWALEESKSGDATKAVDSKGSNEGTITGATVAAYGAATLYGGDTPVIPRAIDNAPTVQADAIGSGSALFVASNTDYISVGADASLYINDNNWSLSFWFKTNTTQDDYMISGGDESDNGMFAVRMRGDSSGEIRLYIKDFTNTQEVSHNTTTTGLNDNSWHHYSCTFTWSSKTLEVYVDGVSDGTSSNASIVSLANSDDGIHIGKRYSSTYYYDGNICQVGIWSTVLTQAQIQSIMEKTYAELTASEKTNLVSYWALDEAATNDGSVAIVEDKNDTTFGSNITPTWSDAGGAGTASVSGQVITFPQSGVSQVNASDASAGIIKINATVTNYTGSGNVNLPWDGAGGSNMLISANGTFEYYANAADASWSIYTPDGAGCTVTINSMKKPNGNYGALI